MQNMYGRGLETIFIICILLHGMLMENVVKYAVEGNSAELECRTNSSFGIDWGWYNGTANYEITREGNTDNKFRSHYAVTNITKASQHHSILSISLVKHDHYGLYICSEGEQRRNLTVVYLVVITIPTCHSIMNDNMSWSNQMLSSCKFSFNGNISASTKWKQEFCSNETRLNCTEKNGFCNVSLVFPDGVDQQLPFSLNLSAETEAFCDVSCATSDKETYKDLSSNIQMEVSLLCSLRQIHLHSTTTEYPSVSKTGLIAIVGVTIFTAMALFVIVVVISCKHSSGRGCKKRKTLTSQNNTKIRDEVRIAPGYIEPCDAVQNLNDEFSVYQEIKPEDEDPNPPQDAEVTLCDNSAYNMKRNCPDFACNTPFKELSKGDGTVYKQLMYPPDLGQIRERVIFDSIPKSTYLKVDHTQ